MKRYNFVVMDFETGSTYTDSERMTPLEIAAIALDGRTLEEIDGGTFHSFMRPRHIIESVSYDDQLIQDGALAKNGISRASIGSFPEEKMVWNNFVDFCLKFAVGSSEYDRPIFVGFNNNGFDDIITKNLCERYKTKKPNNKLVSLDLMKDLYQWSEGITGIDAPEKLSFDYWREYLDLPQMDTGKAHEALYDVMQTVMVFRRLQEWRRRLIKKNPLKGSFAPRKEQT